MKHESIQSEPLSRPVEEEGNGFRGAHPLLSEKVQDVAIYGAVQQLWKRRRTLGVIVGAFLTIAIIYLLGARSEYTSSASLMPEQQSDATPSIAGLDLLQEFGGVLGGLNPGNFMQDSRALPIEIYPDILDSSPILLELLHEDVSIPSQNQTATLERFMTDLEPFSAWDALGEGIQGTARWLTSWTRSERTPVILPDSSVVQLSDEEMLVLEDLRDRVSAEIDKKTGVLTVSATLPDPHVSAQVAGMAVSSLTEYVTRYRLEKLEQDLGFIQGRHDEAKARFDAALAELAAYQDRNRNLVRNMAKTEEQRLQAEYDMAFSVYNSLASRLEEARIKVQEKTPVFQVLQPVAVPLRKSHPQRLLIVFLALLIGGAVGSAVVLSGVDFERVKRTFRS